ncbi:helix-turn-helix domain-containing protein (plasmid) [Streptomyces sp. NBC_01278]|uniref:helix-turn-helix domain-containing protein n=1 Tax=Streptomyces sp. NBC_01278 TaxID=2903809 RepID=UPI002E2F5644|nr:helix-turn-helix transcriptional regulator [Streptomyces sp. NBC_01278]
MAANVRATFLRISLGAELTRLREQAGLTGDQAARKVGCAPSAISRVESGTSGFQRIEQFARLLDAYDVSRQNAAVLTDWYKNAKREDWWAPIGSVLPSGLSTFLAFESGARRIQVWTPMVVNGLFQTEEYAEALIEGARIADDRTAEFVESAVKVRMNRKKRITEDGMKLVCIMDQSALTNMVGGLDLMRAQYEEIKKLSALPNVTLRFIPAKAPAYRVLSGEFQILDFDLKELPGPVVASTTVAGETRVLSKERPVRQFIRRFDVLAQGALPVHDTPAFIDQVAREVEKEHA